jgi:hypothetical protein
MSARVQVFGRRNDGLTTRHGGRRLKSAKARSRGQLDAAGSERYGDLMLAPTSMVEATLAGCDLHVCRQARLGACDVHLGVCLERINGRSAHR